MLRLHEPTDEEKLKKITESIRENGWQGAPLVEVDGMLITGMHRSEAWERAGNYGYQIPTVDIRDLVADYDEQMDNLMESLDWYDALMRVVDTLPAETQEYYGIDLH